MDHHHTLANQVELGKILKLFYVDRDTQSQINSSTIELVIGGIQSDKCFGKEDREILIGSLESYRFLSENDIHLPHGGLGENILLDSGDLKLPLGQRISCGEAILEINLYCPVCNHLSSIRKDLPKLIKDSRGIFARVIKEGIIQVGDSMFLIDF